MHLKTIWKSLHLVAPSNNVIHKNYGDGGSRREGRRSRESARLNYVRGAWLTSQLISLFISFFRDKFEGRRYRKARNYTYVVFKGIVSVRSRLL